MITIRGHQVLVKLTNEISIDLSLNLYEYEHGYHQISSDRDLNKMAEHAPSMIDKLTGLLDNAHTPEEQGQAFGNMMTNMFNLVQAQPQGDPDVSMRNFMGALLGDQLADQIAREAQIRTFFEESIRTHVMSEAITLTKERFNLPDDFRLQVPLEIVFAPQQVTKADEPNAD